MLCDLRPMAALWAWHFKLILAEREGSSAQRRQSFAFANRRTIWSARSTSI